MGLGLLSCSQLIGVEPQGTIGPSLSWGGPLVAWRFPCQISQLMTEPGGKA